MTAANILTELENALTHELALMGMSDTDTLSAYDNARLTDKLATVLETVNPTNNYPSTPR